MTAESSQSAHHAALLLRDAALILSVDAATSVQRNRYQEAVRRFDAILDRHPDRSQILEASPFVIEMSGRNRTLVEMIESEPDDDDDRFRLATLLLRALIWKMSPWVFAEFERDIFRDRVKIGIAGARKVGHLHVRPRTIAGQTAEVKKLFQEGVGKQEIAKRLGISATSVRRFLDEFVRSEE